MTVAILYRYSREFTDIDVCRDDLHSKCFSIRDATAGASSCETVARRAAALQGSRLVAYLVGVNGSVS